MQLMQLIIIIFKYICQNSFEDVYHRGLSKVHKLWAKIIKMHELQNETA